MKTKKRLILFVLVFGFIALEVIALLSVLYEDKNPVARTSYVSTPSYSGGSSSSVAIPFRSVNPLFSHKPSVVSTPQYNTPRFQPTVTMAWQIHRFSAQTVHNIGSGGGVGGGSIGATSSSAGTRGIQTTAISTPTIALPPMALAARNIKDGMTAEEGLRANAPRRVIIDSGDDYGTDGDLKPDYEPTDPFFTPVGDIPWLWMILLLVLYAIPVRIRSKNAG